MSCVFSVSVCVPCSGGASLADSSLLSELPVESSVLLELICTTQTLILYYLPSQQYCPNTETKIVYSFNPIYMPSKLTCRQISLLRHPLPLYLAIQSYAAVFAPFRGQQQQSILLMELKQRTTMSRFSHRPAHVK